MFGLCPNLGRLGAGCVSSTCVLSASEARRLRALHSVSFGGYFVSFPAYFFMLSAF